MSQLFEVLAHPSRWNDVDGLAPETRVVVSLLLLALSVALAALASVLSARWVKRRGALPSGPAARSEAKVRRGLSLLVGFLGLYLAVEVAPLPERLERILSGTAFVLGALVAARWLIHLVALLVGTSVTHVQASERERLEREYVPLVQKATTLAVTLILVIVVAKHFGQDVTSLVAALGVGSLAIGLAAQQTLGNMIAGFTLLADRPFRPGDRVQLATGEVGEVMEIGVRATRIVLASHNLLIVPNADLVNSRVVNFHRPTPAARGEVKLTVAYGSDVERASHILVELALGDERVAKEPAPVARVVALGNVGVDLSVGFEVTNHVDGAAVEDGLRRAILRRFAAEKIDLPFPRTDVVLVDQRNPLR
jgi:MscS family membrane protein